MSLYEDCSELTIHLFYKILETGDYSLLLKEPFEDPDETALSNKWNEIYEEYCKLSEDNKTLMYFMICNELVYLKCRKNIGTTLVNSLIDRRDSPIVITAYIDELAKWKLVIDKNKPLEAEVANVQRNIKLSENKIRLKEDELSKYKSEEGEDEMSLEEQILAVELALDKNEIDPKRTSVTRWVAMLKRIIQRNEALAKLKR